MKWTKTISLLSAALLAGLILAGCGASDPAPLTLEKDFGLTVGGTWFPIHEDAAPLLAALGDDYELYAAPSCLFLGEDKEFDYDGVALFTNPDGDLDIWYLAAITSNAYETARGIRIGSSQEDLTAAYGEKYYWESDYEIVYSISGVQGDLASPCIIFRLDGQEITAIDIYYPTNAN
ncbi:MAG: hypothetical protein WDA02_04565 [Saccharofermentanales bacterium]